MNCPIQNFFKMAHCFLEGGAIGSLIFTGFPITVHVDEIHTFPTGPLEFPPLLTSFAPLGLIKVRGLSNSCSSQRQTNKNYMKEQVFILRRIARIRG